MSRKIVTLIAAAFLLGLVTGTASAGQSTMTSTRTTQFEIVSVKGNVLVVKGPEGAREITVPPDFRFTVDGKSLAVGELKAGMSGTATVTSTTTVKPVYITEVKSAKVKQAFGNAIIVSSSDGGYKRFTEAEAKARGVKIMRDGKEIEFQQVRANDVLTAVFVTEQQVPTMTEQQVNATLAAAKPATPAAAAAASTAKPAAAPAPTPAAAAPAAAPAAAAPRTLPKTASPLPLIGMAGAALLALGATLTAFRRRRT